MKSGMDHYVSTIYSHIGICHNDALYSNLTRRWIEGVHSFGVYFPAKSKEKEARTKGFHYTNPGEKHF